MKKKLTLAGLLLTGLLAVIFSCNKTKPALGHTATEKSAPDLSPVTAFLRDTVQGILYDSLDLRAPYVTSTDSGRTWFVRYPFRGYPVAHKFILIKTGPTYQPLAAAFFQITRDTAVHGIVPSALGFYGSIQRNTLTGTPVYNSPVSGGYIQAQHPKTVLKYAEEEPVELPEIVIYGDDPDYDVAWELLLDEGGGGGDGGFSGYSPASGGGGGGSSSSAAASADLSYAQAELDELQAANPEIDLDQRLNCLTALGSDPSTAFSATLYVRVPNPANPNEMWVPGQASSVGHVFLSVTVTNSTASATQYVGFYGQGGVLYGTETVLGYSVPSKIVDNSGHPYNASLTAKLTRTQFNTIVSALEIQSENKYNISSYNCTDYALDAFNAILPIPLQASGLNIPGEAEGSTPNALFKDLQTGPAEGSNTQIAISNATLTAGTSNGPCN